MAAGLCAICEREQAKYKCPNDGVPTCSLACSKAHKANCTGTPATHPSNMQTLTGYVINTPPEVAEERQEPEQTPHDESLPDLPRLAVSKELQELLRNSPSLRAELRNIYSLTLEENWMETITSRQRTRGRRGGGLQTKRLGRWSEERGFRRGLGKVKRIRDNTDRSSKVDLAAFGEFCRLVLGERALT